MPRRPLVRFRGRSLPGQATLGVLLLVALWLGGLHAFTRIVEAPPPAPQRHADAIVVLTGGSNRLQTGFALLREGLAEDMFVSGVYRGVEVRELLDLLRLPDEDGDDRIIDRITLGFEAHDTAGNARESVAWLRRKGYKTYHLVTANYHLKRALLEFNREGPELMPLPRPVTPEGLDMDNWWRNKTHRSLIIREYMKFLYAQARAALVKGASL